MNIATITCHDVYNYGASLQAYALQEYCERLGCKYQIIDYKPEYLSHHYSLTKISNGKYDKPFLRQLYILAKLPFRLKERKRKRRFDYFTSHYLHLTPVRYPSNEDLSGNPPLANLYIAGSDQIWNTLFLSGRDRAFYLDFVKSGRKISYAASFATDKIYNNAQDFVSSSLQNFDAISVRESSALDLLKCLGSDGILVADPVFLLGENDWEKLLENEENISHDKYILVYDCEKSTKLRTVAEELKRQTGVPIHTISPTSGRYADKDHSMSGPLEFLKYISGASYVVANSFHALAFSLIFRKPFFIVNRTEGINARMRDFLSFLNLSNRLIDSPSEVTLSPVDYHNAEPRLNVLIKNSKEFLKTQIFTDV